MSLRASDRLSGRIGRTARVVAADSAGLIRAYRLVGDMLQLTQTVLYALPISNERGQETERTDE